MRHVFGVPGGQTLALYDAILDREPGLRHVLVRDERSAAYAADAYARVTGRAGVCDATVGQARRSCHPASARRWVPRCPWWPWSASLPARLAPHRYRSAASQALDQAALLAAVTKWQATVPDAATLPALVRQAFREATTGRPGPVALFLPQDVLDGPAGDASELRRQRPLRQLPGVPAWPRPGRRRGRRGGAAGRAAPVHPGAAGECCTRARARS